MNVEFNETTAIVAVGMNGEMVILSVSEDNPDLSTDAQSMPANVALSSAYSPQAPGLYQFKGSSCLESLDQESAVMVHRGTFELVSAY
ncbi:MAG: hypothetical protein R3F26_09185 [Gammaproteobacteria bacterium]